MKKVLILAYDFPPFVSVGGLRPYNWFKYLKEFCVEPVVVTRDWENKYGSAIDYISKSPHDEAYIETTPYGEIIRTPYVPTFSNRLYLKHGEQKYKLLRKAFTAYNEVSQFHRISGNKKQIYLEAERYLSKNKVDCIIATGDPFILFSYASKLSAKFDIPWIADYRDPWSQNKNHQLTVTYNKWLRHQEVKIVSTAHSIITVSEFLKAKLHELFPEKTIHILPNGYDPEVIDSIAEIPQSTDCLTISFVGTIYNWHPWQSVLKAFSDVAFVSEAPIKLRFYGINITDEVEEFIATLPRKVRSSIELFSRMPNQELLERIAKENVMLLFNYYSFMGTKIFDYVGVRRKILLCYTNDAAAFELKEQYYNIEEMDGVSKTLQEDLIVATNSGVTVADAAHFKAVLWDLLDEFQREKHIDCDSHGVERYSRKIQVEQLAELFKMV